MNLEQVLHSKKFRTITPILSIALFVLSFTQPCFSTNSNSGEAGQGLGLLISGLLGFGVCPAWYSWLTNPLLMISWLSFKKNLVKTTVLSFIAVVCCLSFLFVDHIMIDEAGHSEHIVSRQLGYWLWVSSALVLFFGNTIRYIVEKRVTS